MLQVQSLEKMLARQIEGLPSNAFPHPQDSLTRSHCSCLTPVCANNRFRHDSQLPPAQLICMPANCMMSLQTLRVPSAVILHEKQANKRLDEPQIVF
jgi:hypothetical protein